MNVIQTKQILMYTQAARRLLFAIGTICNLRSEASSSLKADELNRLKAFWQQQLVHALSELGGVIRLTGSKATVQS